MLMSEPPFGGAGAFTPLLFFWTYHHLIAAINVAMAIIASMIISAFSLVVSFLFCFFLPIFLTSLHLYYTTM